ncbi:MAG: protein translocase SEC61 complex subunit gamma [Nanoarchaeota archaeon]
MDHSNSKPKIKDRLMGFFRKCVRVWHVLKKPTREEVMTVAKVSAIGIIAIGFVGFLISIVMKFLLPR